MSEWQPIETAPKDGTRIILAQNGGVEVGSWHAEDSGYYETISSTASERKQRWVQTSDGYWTGLDEIYDPTHWMPLPSPPDHTTG